MSSDKLSFKQSGEANFRLSILDYLLFAISMSPKFKQIRVLNQKASSRPPHDWINKIHRR